MYRMADKPVILSGGLFDIYPKFENVLVGR